MIDKPLGDIDSEDLQRLQVNGVAESRSLEYKQALPGGTDLERKEFLGDVSSFANATGGDLLYGVTEAREDGKPTGIPKSVDGLAGINNL
jgi:predicted HTH transcriptional regulator